MTRSTFAKVIVGIIGALFVVMSFGSAAGAVASSNPDDVLSQGSQPSNSAAQCADPDQFTGSTIEGEAVGDDPNLPLNRWGDGATGELHSRLGSKIVDDTDQKIMRSFQAMMLSVGDSMWRVTGGLTEFATTFEILDQVGCTADKAAAGVGEAMLTGIAPLVVVAGVIALVWRTSQGKEQPGKKAAAMVLILGAFGGMLAGAQQTARTNRISPPSPAYIATTFNDTLNRVATAPTEALTSPNVAAYGRSGTVLRGNPTHCRNYVAALRARYLEEGAPGSSVPLAMSAMWEQSGLPAYIAVQYGSKNAYGQGMYCRMLERSAGITSGRQNALLKEAVDLAGSSNPLPGDGTVDGEGGPSSELFAGGTNNTEDQAGIFWAACRWNGTAWTVADGWGPEGVSEEGHQITNETCGDVWASWDAEGSGLDWTDSPSQIHQKTSSSESGSQVADYLLVWHGDAYVGSFATAAVYVVSSFVVMCVFGMISVGVIVSKILAIVMIVLIFLMMTLALFPSQGDNNKLTKFVKFWLGMTVFSSAMSLILSLVALITGFVNAAGTEAFGQGSFLSILWLGFAPVTAVVLLHMVAKHAIGMPSPFKPSGALAWGAAAGGTGAGLGVGLDRLARRGKGYGQSLVQGGMARGRKQKDPSTKADGRDQKMPTGGKDKGSEPINPSAGKADASGGDVEAGDKAKEPVVPEDTRGLFKKNAGKAGAHLNDLPGSANAWRKRIPSDMKNWLKAKPIRRVAIPAAALALGGIPLAGAVLGAGVAGLGVAAGLATSGAIGGAVTAPGVAAAAIGARALWRRRQGAAAVLNGRVQNEDGTWESRDAQRARWQQEYASRNAVDDAEAAASGEVVAAPPEPKWDDHGRDPRTAYP